MHEIEKNLSPFDPQIQSLCPEVFLKFCKIVVSARFCGVRFSVDFHTFTLQFQTLHSVFVNSLENCHNFSKTPVLCHYSAVGSHVIA